MANETAQITQAPATTATVGTPSVVPMASKSAQPGAFQMVLPFVLIFGIMYFLMIRPQQKKMKEHQKMVDSIQRGDEVVTNSGMFGKVVGVTDTVLTLEIADNVKVRMVRGHVAKVVKGENK